MVVFGVIGFLVLLVIFFALRAQKLQQQVNQVKSTQKASDNQYRYLLNQSNALGHELQQAFQSKLNATIKHGLIAQEDVDLATLLIGNVDTVVKQCCEKQSTVQEAVMAVIESAGFDEERLQQFIAKQSSQVKMAWSKNQLQGFIIACRLMSQGGQLEN